MVLVIGGLVILAPGGSVTLVTRDHGGLGGCDPGGWWVWWFLALACGLVARDPDTLCLVVWVDGGSGDPMDGG
jgi:hypothetical protein